MRGKATKSPPDPGEHADELAVAVAQALAGLRVLEFAADCLEERCATRFLKAVQALNLVLSTEPVGPTDRAITTIEKLNSARMFVDRGMPIADAAAFFCAESSHAAAWDAALKEWPVVFDPREPLPTGRRPKVSGPSPWVVLERLLNATGRGEADRESLRTSIPRAVKKYPSP